MDNVINCETDTIIYKTIKEEKRWKKRLLNASDIFVSLLIISPLVVTHWRGTWAYMDHHAEYFPPWNCFLFGGVLHTTFALLREPLHDEFAKVNNRKKSIMQTIKRHIISKLYTYAFSVGCNMHWHGGWAVMQLHLGPDLLPAIIVSIICLIGLIALRSVRNLVAPPVVILTDFKEVYFTFPTRFRIEGTRDPGLYVLDCLFSVLVIGSLVVFVWRGLWVLFDLTLFPGDPALSAFGSLAIGYGVVGVTFALQPLMRWACERLHGFWRVLVADCFLFFSFIGTVNVWRGVWQLLDIYFLPDNKLLSDWITHGVSIILLILLNCSNSVLVRGVYIDAEEPAGQCVIFPVYYIRLFFQKERSKKQKRLNDNNIKQTTGASDQHNNTLLLIDYDKKNSVLVKNNLSTINTTMTSSTMHVTSDKPTILCSNFSNKNNTQQIQQHNLLNQQQLETNKTSSLNNTVDDDDDEKNTSDEHTNLCTEN